MNVKYNYLYEYLINNNNEEPFNIDKFNLYSNSVDYLYFFVCNAEKKEYNVDVSSKNSKISSRRRGRKNKKDEEEEEEELILATELINDSFIEIENDYYIKINRFIPVIAIVENKYVFRNLDAFYIKGFIKVPIEYFKNNPAINNYSKLVRNITNSTNFDFIDITTFLDEQSLGNNYNYSENDYTFNNNILFNNWIGLSNKTNNNNYDVEWVKLNFNQITQNVIMYTAQPVNMYDTNIKNIQSKIEFNYVINEKNENNQYKNNIAKIAHNYYMPYCFNFNNMNAYSWINFISNQYDYGVFITEDNQINFIENWNNLKNKYFDTFGYPKIKIQRNISTKFLQEDPKWKTVEDKISYLKDCIKIGNKYYTKNYYYVCCDHEYKKLHGKYYQNMIIKVDNQEICKYCGELLGNYNDEKVFAEGMSEFDKVKINYKWNNKVTEKRAKESWNNLSSMIDAIDNKFSMDNNNVNKFIQMYHNTYEKIIKEHSYNKNNNLFEKIKQIYLSLYRNTNDINILTNQITNTFIQDIYGDKINETSENSMICIAKLKRMISKYISMYYKKYVEYTNKAKEAMRRNKKDLAIAYEEKAKIDPDKIFNFMNLIQKRSNNFIKMITIAYIIGIIYGNNHVINFSDMNWSVIMGNTYSENIEKTTIILLNDDILDLSIFNTLDNNKTTINHVIEYINNYFKSLGGGVSVNILTDVVDNINIDKITQQEIKLRQNKVSDIPYVLDSFTCYDILTRKFNSNMKSLQEFAHAKYPTQSEYINDKYTNNIAKYFNSLKRITHFNYTSFIHEINNYIKRYENILFNGVLNDETYEMPSADNFNNEMKNIEKLAIITKKTILNFEKKCIQNNIKYNKMSDYILIGIDDIMNKFDLFLNNIDDDNNTNYEYTFNIINKKEKKDNALEINKRLCDIIIRSYLLCTSIEEVNIFNILNTCIDNFYLNLIENNINYTFIKNISANDIESLINKFITEFFDYNTLPNNNLKFFFNELKKHTQLFITPDYYLEGNTKIKRILTKINTDEEREIELKEMDREENGIEKFIDFDKLDFVNFGSDIVEKVDQNELIGGEIEDDLIIDEDAY